MNKEITRIGGESETASAMAHTVWQHASTGLDRQTAKSSQIETESKRIAGAILPAIVDTSVVLMEPTPYSTGGGFAEHCSRCFGSLHNASMCKYPPDVHQGPCKWCIHRASVYDPADDGVQIIAQIRTYATNHVGLDCPYNPLIGVRDHWLEGEVRTDISPLTQPRLFKWGTLPDGRFHAQRDGWGRTGVW